MTDDETGDDASSCEHSTEEQEQKEENELKAIKRSGIVYLSRVPTRMNVKLVREYFSQFGLVGRIFLQPSDKSNSSKKQKHARYREFSEGWVEFTDKEIARSVAEALNNQLVGGRRRHPWVEDIWNIRYLPDFKWSHLNERMAYEKAVKTKRLRLEVGQAKKEAQFFSEQLKFSKRLAATGDKEGDDSNDDGEEVDSDAQEQSSATAPPKRRWNFKQKLPDEAIIAAKSRKNNKPLNKKKTTSVTSAAQSDGFLQSLFTSGT